MNLYKVRNELETQIIAITGYTALNISLYPFLDKIVNGFISLIFGVLLVVITHYVKKWLNERSKDK